MREIDSYDLFRQFSVPIWLFFVRKHRLLHINYEMPLVRFQSKHWSPLFSKPPSEITDVINFSAISLAVRAESG